MPLIAKSSYKHPYWLIGGHSQTIHPVLFRKVPTITTEKERLELKDGDFLDLAWHKKGNQRLAIISHGLEGNSRAKYVQGMANALSRKGWDILAWTFRGCSDEMNRLPQLYHSGKTEDLEAVVQHALSTHEYHHIDLIGFSLGGNLTLKYIGERGHSLDSRIKKGLAFSVPCDLADSATALEHPQNKLYMARFAKTLREKLRSKHANYPNFLNIDHLEKVCSFREFDDRYTAPLHGFADAQDYWNQSSCRQFLPKITTPTLLISAQNDPILGPACYPYEEAQASNYFYLETPQNGGHVGFGNGNEYWSEKRAAEFLSLP